MLIKQLSIFLENKKGRFTEVAKLHDVSFSDLLASMLSKYAKDLK